MCILLLNPTSQPLERHSTSMLPSSSCPS
jgi:hypothetical protein